MLVRYSPRITPEKASAPLSTHALPLHLQSTLSDLPPVLFILFALVLTIFILAAPVGFFAFAASHSAPICRLLLLAQHSLPGVFLT